MIFADRKNDGLGITPYHSLPIEPPLDKHKWFYMPREPNAFISENGKKNGFCVTKTIYCQPSVKRKFALTVLSKLLFSSEYQAEEFYTQDMWWVLSRQ